MPLVALLAAAAFGADDPKVSPTAALPPTYIVVGTPADLDALLGRLGRPDFLLKSGSDPSTPQERPLAAPVVELVAVSGEVRGELATVEVALTVHVEGSGRQWVPIRLDGLSPSRVEERGRDAPVRAAKEGGWSVEVEGPGRHELLAKLVVATKSTADGGRLELSIPEAPSTRVELGVEGPVESGQAGLDILAVEADAARGSRLRGNLTPRRRLDLSWKTRAAGEPGLPPALLVQGTLAAEVDRGSLRVNSSWRVSTDRGIARSIVVRLDPADELVGVDLDLAPVTPTIRREGAWSELTIPLREPLRPNKPRKLDLVTRRPLAASPPMSMTYRGVEFLGSVGQSGVLAVGKSEDLWIGGSVGRGIRQVDPRDNLPPSLTARPSTALAYRFVEQPFELTLRVDPTTPIVRVEPRSTVVVGDSAARLDVCLDYQVTQGRVFDVAVELPTGFVVTGVGPETTVAGSTVRAEGVSRRLVIQLTPRARDEGTFRVRLRGRQALNPGPTSSIGLPRAEGVVAEGALISVLSGRGVGIDMAEQPASGRCTSAPGVVPADWPAEVASASTPAALWLRQEGSPDVLPILRTSRSQSLWHQSTITATVGVARAEVRQEMSLRSADEGVSEVDLVIPAAASGRWEVLAGGVLAGQGIEHPAGGTRQRVRLIRAAAGTMSLRFRLDVPLPPLAGDGRNADLIVPVIGLAEGTSGLATATIQADPGLWVEPSETTAWVRVPVSAAERASVFRSTGRDEPQSLAIRVSRPELLPLPDRVISRLDLRTDRAAHGASTLRASLQVDGPSPSLTVEPPRGAEWVEVRVDGAIVSQTYALEGSSGRRILLPRRDDGGGHQVVIVYTLPSNSVDGAWEPPGFPGSVVLRARWEVRVPWSQVLVGVPRGWEDGNEWYWDSAMWKRRPIEGGDEPAVGAGSDHGYQFSRPGGATALRPLLLSKAALVGICSGSVLAVGLPLVFWPWRGRGLAVAALGLAGATLTAWEPGASLAIAQSSSLGIGLTGLAAVALRVMERRGPAARTLVPFEAAVEDPSGPDRAGSDESTFVRPRAGTTMEHATPALVVEP